VEADQRAMGPDTPFSTDNAASTRAGQQKTAGGWSLRPRPRRGERGMMGGAARLECLNMEPLCEIHCVTSTPQANPQEMPGAVFGYKRPFRGPQQEIVEHVIAGGSGPGC